MRPVRTALIVAFCALAVAACDANEEMVSANSDKAVAFTKASASSDQIAAQEPQKDTSGVKQAAANTNNIGAAPTEAPKSAMLGRWVVERLWIDTTGITAWGVDDPALVGSVMEVTPEKSSWVHKASDNFDGSDICGNPTPAVVLDAAAAKKIGASFDGALTAFGINRSQIGPLHEWACLGDGNWGPTAAGGSLFYLTKDGRMVMSYYDGTVLLLKKQ